MNKLQRVDNQSRNYGNASRVTFYFDDDKLHTCEFSRGESRAAVALKLSEMARGMNDVPERPSDVSPWASPR